jgi:SAM-dependent methyltransferase
LPKVFQYTGKDNLETMGVAVKYNDHLGFLVRREIPPSVGAVPSVLDFGAGMGVTSDLLRTHGIGVSCLEPDDEFRSDLADRGYPVFKDVSDIEESSYDLIYLLNVLEHIEDDALMVKRLNAILKPGGRLLVYVPAFQFLYSSRDRKVGHYCRYRRGRLRSLAQAAGMEINRLEYCDPLGFFAAIAYRLRDHGDGRLSEAKVRFFDKYLFPLSPPLQPLLRRVLGKNVLLVATKPGGTGHEAVERRAT